MSSVGGDSNLPGCLPYMAFITATRKGKTNCPTQPDGQKKKKTIKKQVHFEQRQIAQTACPNYSIATSANT